jgi:hypothetical protein
MPPKKDQKGGKGGDKGGKAAGKGGDKGGKGGGAEKKEKVGTNTSIKVFLLFTVILLFFDPFQSSR